MSQEATKNTSETNDLLSILALADQFYQKQMRSHPHKGRAIDYLKQRGLTGQVAKTFGIGFAPPGWDNLLQAIGTSAETVRHMIKAGLVIKREDSAARADSPQREGQYDRFRDRIIFPIRDSRGRVIGFGGRVLTDEKPKYLNSPETPVYHKGNELYGLYEARRSNPRLTRFLIVEGYMDVVALAQHGIDYAVATLGTATSATHLNRLFRLVPDVIYCFDGDQAGRTAAWRGLQATLPILQDARQVRFLFLPEGEDPDTLVRKRGKEHFTALVDNATPLAEFFFDHLSEGLDVGSIEGKSRLGSLAIPLLRQLPEGMYRQLMQERLAQVSGLESRSIESMVNKQATADASAPGADQSSGPPPDYPRPPSDFGDAPGRRGERPAPRAVAKPMPRSPGLKAIELLLFKPEVAVTEPLDLTLLRENGDKYTDLLLEL